MFHVEPRTFYGHAGSSVREADPDAKCRPPPNRTRGPPGDQHGHRSTWNGSGAPDLPGSTSNDRATRPPGRSTWNIWRGPDGSASWLSDRLAAMTPSKHQRDRLETFAALVETSPHNLVSGRARAELRTRHIPECVAFAELVPRGTRRLLDVGSGGGFPGMVVALVRPDVEVHLLDSTKKKTDFLTAASEQLSARVHVHQGRAEGLLGTPLGGSFDIVTARAVAPLEQLVTVTVPFLRRGGLLLAIKGERWTDELAVADEAIRRAGARLVATPDDLLTDAASAHMPRVVMLVRDR